MGVTFMNYSPQRAFNLLADMMDSCDAAVFATELINGRGTEELLVPYTTDKARAFNLMPLELLGIEGSNLDYFVRFRTGRIEMGFVARAQFEVRDLDIPVGTEIVTSVSYRYSLENFRTLLKRAFTQVDVHVDAQGSSALARVSNRR
jgi:hypothetical protein